METWHVELWSLSYHKTASYQLKSIYGLHSTYLHMYVHTWKCLLRPLLVIWVLVRMDQDGQLQRGERRAVSNQICQIFFKLAFGTWTMNRRICFCIHICRGYNTVKSVYWSIKCQVSRECELSVITHVLSIIASAASWTTGGCALVG